MKKRIIAALLAVILTISVLPSVSAADASETETADIPEYIGTEAVADVEAETDDSADTEEAKVDAVETTPVKADLAPTCADIPKISKIAPSQTGLTFTYSAFEGAAKYRVFIRKADDSGWKKLGDAASASFSYKTDPDNTVHTYTVRALDKNGKFISGYDKTGFTFNFYDTPVLSGTQNVYAGQKITWKAVDGAPAYKVFIMTDSGWKSLGVTDQNFFVNTEASNNVQHRYTVRTWDAENKCSSSYYDRTGVSAVYYAAPAVTSFTPVSGGVKVNWNAVSGAAQYALFCKNGSKWKCIAVTSDTNAVHTGLKADTVYNYTVRTMDSSGSFLSGYNSKGFDRKYYANPSFSSISAENGGLYLQWEADEDCAAYRIYRKVFKGSWECLGKSDTGSFTDLTAKKNTLYTYTLRGIDENGSLLTHFTDTGVYYYNNALANGKITVNGASIRFKDGKVNQGYVTVNGKKYYYNSSGNIMKNGVVGSKSEGYTYADANGVCNTDEETKLAATFLMTYCKGTTLKEKAKYAFMYMADNYPYVRVYNDMPDDETDVPPFANELFTTKQGTCYRYAAAYAYIMRIAGYRSRFVYGLAGTLYHGWTEVYVDGTWLKCDVDANIPSYGNADYAAYMMSTHIWSVSVYWRTELTLKDGKATWSKV